MFMAAGKVYQVYVLQNSDGRFYIGLSESVQVRLQQHNQGISRWTRKFRLWFLVWTSEGLSLSNARRLENRLKHQKGGAGFKLLTGLTGLAKSGS